MQEGFGKKAASPHQNTEPDARHPYHSPSSHNRP